MSRERFVDGGTITNKSVLPITTVMYARPLHFDYQYLKIDIGPLKCSSLKSPITIEDSIQQISENKLAILQHDKRADKIQSQQEEIEDIIAHFKVHKLNSI